MDVPGDGYGYNITLSTSDSNFMSTFSQIYLSNNQCPTPTEFEYEMEEPMNNFTLDGYTFPNLEKSGKWWLMFECTSSNATPTWYITTKGIDFISSQNMNASLHFVDSVLIEQHFVIELVLNQLEFIICNCSLVIHFKHIHELN
jgi:hypothetical protein